MEKILLIIISLIIVSVGMFVTYGRKENVKQRVHSQSIENNNQDWKIYRNEKDEFEFKYPSNTTVLVQNDSSEFFSAFMIDSADYDELKNQNPSFENNYTLSLIQNNIGRVEFIRTKRNRNISNNSIEEEIKSSITVGQESYPSADGDYQTNLTKFERDNNVVSKEVYQYEKNYTNLHDGDMAIVSGFKWVEDDVMLEVKSSDPAIDNFDFEYFISNFMEIKS